MLAPTSEAELSDILKGAQTGVTITGGGTRGIGHATGDTGLSTAAMTGVTLYEPGALTLVAQAGTPLAEVQATLAAEGQQLPFEPPLLGGLLHRNGASTIGGVVACNASGPRRMIAGACRDSLIGVRFVDGTGEVLKNGGRVMKNVTGYDLVKLMAGAQGTLGILTEVAFKVLPKPDTSATLHLHGLDVAGAVAAMADALTSPFEVNGAAHDPAQGLTHLRIEGFAASVAYRTQQLRDRLSRHGDITVSDADSTQTLWDSIRDVGDFHDAPGDIWRISVKPSDAPAVVTAIRAEATLLDWGGGLIWARMAPGTNLRARMGGMAGHATLLRATAHTRAALGTFHPEPPAIVALSNGLRGKFDPRGILNPGLMG